MRILIAEDNIRFANLMAEYLVEDGHGVDIENTIINFIEMAKAYIYDLYILDLRLPDGNGRSIIERMRESNSSTPIMVVTALTDLNERVGCLDCGADDCVLKPVHPKELLARVRALRRRPPVLAPAVMRAGDLLLDCSTGEVSCSGKRLNLMRSEQRLLDLLMRRRGRLVTKDAIENALVYPGRETTPNAVDKLVSRLRKTLEERPAQVAIKTVRGVGYVLEEVR